MLKLRNIEEFSMEVERLVAEKKMTYLEAVMEHLTTSGIDVDSAKVKSLISKEIQEKIYAEAVALKILGRKK